MLRIVHTADWHLGHTLHGVSRAFEHDHFLRWLLDTLADVSADALIVAGDIFDSANPPASAQTLLYRFLRDVKQRLPQLDVVLIAGNHDSAARLSAPSALLEAFDIHVVGTLPVDASGEVDWPALVVPLRDRQGQPAAWCGAMPFLRNADLASMRAEEGLDPFVEGVRSRYGELVSALRTKSAGDGAMVLTGHCYMTGTQLSELSERKILGGNQHALPVAIFPDDMDYVALGHLHRAQSVGGSERVRYSGSPIPLSLDEGEYTHQVLQVEIGKTGACPVTPLPVPRAVEVLRVPRQGACSLDEAIAELSALECPEVDPEIYPFLDVRVRLDKPEPGLRQQLDRALEGKPVRLLKVGVELPGTGDALGDTVALAQLEDLAPDEVFSRRYTQVYDDMPNAELKAAFHELLAAVQEEA